jgi:hypothetical protein
MNPGAKVNVDRYRDDRLYPRVTQAVQALLAKGNVVAPVDVLVHPEIHGSRRPAPGTSCGRARARSIPPQRATRNPMLV